MIRSKILLVHAHCWKGSLYAIKMKICLKEWWREKNKHQEECSTNSLIARCSEEALFFPILAKLTFC